MAMYVCNGGESVSQKLKCYIYFVTKVFKAYLCTFRERMVILDGIDTPLSLDCSLTCRTFYRNRGYSTSLRRAFCNPKTLLITVNHANYTKIWDNH